MKIQKVEQKEDQSFLSRGRRDLSTPQGSKLLSALLICGFLSILIDLIGERLHIPKSIIYPAIVIINLAIISIFAFKITEINRRLKEKREISYRQKHGVDYTDFITKGKKDE